MLRTIASLFHKKRKAIEDELNTKTKIDEILAGDIKTEILKNSEINFKLNYSVKKGIIKLETNNKIIAQEIALRIRVLENKLKDGGINFQKLLI